MRPLMAQARAEVVMTLRRGESVLLAIGLPVLFLVTFSELDLIDTGTRDAIDFLAPGILALAVMSTAMVSLGIATGFERQYGVLKRLATTPLGRPALLTAKITAVVAIELLQAAVLLGIAAALGWRPDGAVAAAAAAAALGTIAFAGLGLLMAGTLKAELTLALANGLYLVLLLFGGMLVPLDRLPSALQLAARALPAAALSDLLHATLGVGATGPGRAWLVLGAWAVVTPVAAARWFRWE